MLSTPYDVEFTRAWGEPICDAVVRGCAEDFRVTEELGYELAGTGEHLYLRVRKRDINTERVARELARRLDVRTRDVGFAGLKDRHAVATQWFSGWLPGRADPPVSRLAGPGWEILEVQRHRSKLRRGGLTGNRFELTVRGLPACKEITALLDARLRLVAGEGVPNYFGEQRFGCERENLVRAEALLTGCFVERDRHLRGLYISSARAFLFNLILSQRVADGSWVEVNAECSGSAPLYGAGARLDALEERVLAPWSSWCDGLERLGLKTEGRALRMQAEDLCWQHVEEEDALVLSFTLAKGSYATALLREIVRAAGMEEL